MDASDAGIVERISIWSLPTFKNTFAGTIAGISGVIVGHPFDTIKVCVYIYFNYHL